MISTTNDYQKLQARVQNVYTLSFPVVIVAIARGQFLQAGRAENPRFAVGIVILSIMVQDI